jgi:hypothetical protein
MIPEPFGIQDNWFTLKFLEGLEIMELSAVLVKEN